MEGGPPNKRRRKEKASASMAGSSNPDAPPVSAVAYIWNERNVFHAINEDRMPSDKLFDRPHYFAILDKLPVIAGHALMITKHKAATMLDTMPPEAAADTMGDLQVRHRNRYCCCCCCGLSSSSNHKRQHDPAPWTVADLSGPIEMGAILLMIRCEVPASCQMQPTSSWSPACKGTGCGL